MKYPMLANYLIFEENQDGTYTVIDRLKCYQFEATREEVAFVMQLDGKTNPVSIVHRMDCGLTDTDAYEIIDSFDEMGVIRHNRILEKTSGMVHYSLFIIRNHTDKLRTGARAFNFLLRIFWLPVLVLGLCFYIASDFTNEKPLLAVLGGLIGLIIGSSLHELSHAATCHGFGGTVLEFGVHITHFLPGAYVLMNDDNVTSVKKRIQISAAGIEMEFLLAGIFLILATQIGIVSSFTFGFALASAASGVFNCLLIDGSDGTTILQYLLETDDIFAKTKKIVRSKQLKHRMRQNGISGNVAIILCYIISVLHFLTPAFIVAIIVWVALGIN